MQVERVLETCLYVNDLAAAEDFYGRVLGLEVHSQVAGRHVFYRCGDAMLLLFNPDVTARGGEVPTHGAHGPGHVAWAVTEKRMAAWREHLAAQGVPVDAEITWPGGGHSLYFRDPSGNSLELATPQTWRRSSE
jgi:catechol 2,3-dioxygenase-like lactoylglutathione lyase family enzyme